jgi:CheY-like chemotaxis protein
LRVLVAEDNAVNRELMVHLLKKRGYTSDVAADGKATLKAAQTGAFDLVLMDIQMPVLGGLEVTAAIRESERTTGRHLPIIATTAHATQEDRERGLRSGVDAYLTKPIQAQQLYETIERVAGRPRVFDESAVLDGLGGDRQLLMKLIDLFLADYPRLIARIGRALRDRRRPALQEGAHALKGSIANFGQTAALEAVRAFETKAKSRSLRGVDAALLKLRKEMTAFNAALEQLRSEKFPSFAKEGTSGPELSANAGKTAVWSH